MFDGLIDAAGDIATKIGGTDFVDEAMGHTRPIVKLLQKLRGATLAGNRRVIRESKHLLFKSLSARFLVTLLTANADDPILVPDKVREIAGELDMFHDCGEPVTAWAEPKLPLLNDGIPTSTNPEDYRPIFAFGWKRSAGQLLTKLILEAFFGIDDFNYLTKGRGPDAAAKKVNQLCSNGLPFVMIADIANCFGSVQQEGLEKLLGLPKAVVKHYVLIQPSVTLLHKPHTIPIGVFGGVALSGLPQGSCASGTIAGILLGPTLKGITSTDRIVLYGDDILIAASSLSEATAFETALKKALESHTFGRFRLKHSGIYHTNDGFDFLKYRHRISSWDGKITLSPSKRCYSRMERKVMAKAAEPGKLMRSKMKLYLSRWMKSFPLWKRTPLSIIFLELSVSQAVGAFIELLAKWRMRNKAKGKSQKSKTSATP